MKRAFILFLFLVLTMTSGVALAQGTKIDGNQIKPGTITDTNISPSAAILFSKINFTGISPSVVAAESPLTFNAPLSRTGNTISMNSIQVPAGGTGLSGVPAGQILFGGTSTVLGSNTNLTWDNTNNRLYINNPTGSYTLDVTGNGRFTAGLVANNSDNANPAGLTINNTATAS